MSEVVRIEGCRSCGSRQLRRFLSLGDMPLSDGFLRSDQLASPEPRFPLDVAFCEDCTLVQIEHTVAPEILFDSDYPYFSSVSETVVDNARANVEARLAEGRLGPRSLVVEIASNDGYLLQFYRARGIPVLGIDPAPGPAAEARRRGIDTLVTFFGLDLALRLRAEGRQADVIHANNVLAHVADTNGFVAGLATLLKPEGVAVIEVPYVRDLVEKTAFDTIYHEHLCYFSVHAARTLFARHGLVLARVERLPIHGGSLRLFVTPCGHPDSGVETLLEEERAAGIDRFAFYVRFGERIEALRAKLLALLTELKRQGARIVGYGAAAKGTILLNYCGIDARFLDYVVDRNPHKQGRYIPGVRLAIRPPEAILADPPDYLLILSWNITDEILRQQQAFRARGGRFVVPVPDPEIL
ncbi:hypothetical protein HRbin40_00227 [bacterium HR40]|nr:hypothetical protein HRbin40_00227 [bacterium HR40]